MHLLQSGVRFNVIALWLGHESTATTHRYVEADLDMKEKARTAGATQQQATSVQDAGRTDPIPASAVTMRRVRRFLPPALIGAGDVHLEISAHSCVLRID